MPRRRWRSQAAPTATTWTSSPRRTSRTETSPKPSRRRTRPFDSWRRPRQINQVHSGVAGSRLNLPDLQPGGGDHDTDDTDGRVGEPPPADFAAAPRDLATASAAT